MWLSHCFVLVDRLAVCISEASRATEGKDHFHSSRTFITEANSSNKTQSTELQQIDYLSIYLSIGINVRFAAMMADVGDGLL